MDKKKAGIIIAAAILIVAQFLPTSESLTGPAISSMAIFLAAITLWICESFPMCIAAMGLMVIMPYFNIMTLGELWPNFGGSAFFFVLATFALTASIENSTFPTRFIAWLVDISKGNSKRLIYGFMMGSALLSSIMSNMATAIMFISISLILIRANGDPERGKSNFAKCLLIGVPAAANIGGFMTMAGTPSNIMGADILQQLCGIEITFAQWMIIGYPVGIVSTLIASFIMTTAFKPEPLDPAAVEYYLSSRETLPPLTTKEKKTLVIIVTMFVLWILGSWVSALNTSVVAILGVVIMMCPGVDVLDWKQFNSKTDWNTIFVIGAVPVLVAGMVNTGASKWLVDTVLSGLSGMPWMVLTVVVALFIMVLRNFIPTGVANFALLQVPLIELAQAAGGSPTTMILILAYWCVVILCLPFDPIYLVAYGEGYYKVNDTLKSGIPLSIILVLFTGLIIPLFAGVMGF